MKRGEIKGMALTHAIEAGRLKKAALIRSIQVAEGNPCFATGQAQACGQSPCAWKEDCR